MKKGIDILIDGMKLVVARHPDARLAVVGPPDPASFGKQVTKWIEESGVSSSIVEIGPADPTLRLEAFADTDIYALPSQGENFGYSVFEAMACGIPVVVSDMNNYAQEIVQNGAGLSVPREAEAVAGAIIMMIEDPEMRGSMGACGKVYSTKYSLEETGRKIAETFQAVLQRRPFPQDGAPRVGNAPENTTYPIQQKTKA